MAINFKAIAERLLADAPRHLSEWLPGGKMHGREFVAGSLKGEAGHSLSVNIDKGIWKDFASNQGGGDLISLYAAIHGIKNGEAAKQFATDKDNKAEDEYFAGPEHKGPIPAHSKYGEHTAVFEYRRADNKVAGYICRFDPPNERKQLIPRTCYIRADKTIYWRWKKWPGLSPLYQLPELLANTNKKVLIVEGEGKANKAQRLLPDWVVIGWCGGVGAVKGTDWSPLKNRVNDIWIWPDADQPGLKAASQIKEILPHVHIVDIMLITPSLPKGWDLGDAPDGYQPEQYMQEAVELPISTLASPVIQPSTLPERLDKLNNEYAVIIRGSQVLIMRYWMGEDGQSQLIFISTKEFLLLQGNNIAHIDDGEGKSKKVNAGKLWLEWEDRQEFEAVYFEPGGHIYKKRYNLWQGFSFNPDADSGKFDLLLAHIHDNICQKDAEQYEWVMAWLADLFQKPNRKLGTALVLRGPMGIGKGIFANHIGKLLGKHYMPISQGSQLTGKFNGHMADKLLMFVDEGWWSDKTTGAGTLRALITEPAVTIEMKGKDAISYANFTRFIMAANADWVVPVGMGDERRFVILDVGTQHQRDIPYFKAIEKQLQDGGYPALLHYLLNYRYDESLPRSIIKTEALIDNKIYSMPDELKWFHSCLYNEKIGDYFLKNSLDNDIPCDKFYDTYLQWCKDMGIKPLADNSLPRMLKKGGIYLVRKRASYDPSGKRPTIYELPTLDSMRRSFEEHIGGKMEWEKI